METVPVREINNQNEAKPLNVYMAPKSKKLNGKNQYSWRKKRINIYNTQKKIVAKTLFIERPRYYQEIRWGYQSHIEDIYSGIQFEIDRTSWLYVF